MLSQQTKDAFLRIMEEELLPAMGCTEPIAVALAASKAREVLGILPDRVAVVFSGNILKNVKSVVVPNTNGLKGIRAAAAAGIVAGDPQKKLEVIADLDEEKRSKIAAYLNTAEIEVSASQSGLLFEIEVTVSKGGHSASVRIVNHHTNIVSILCDGEVLLNKAIRETSEDNLQDKSVLNMHDIVEYADTVDLEPVKPLLDRQIAYNSAIAKEGLTGRWGASIGKILLESFPRSIEYEAMAYAAAGSDARMSGCEMPVVILSGSGNQGMAASLPVIRYAKEMHASQDLLYRSLIVSILTTVHQKSGIGRLSAYCGAISAGCAAGAGISYMHGDGYEGVVHTVVNAMSILSGTICDGAKPSCAAKIGAAVFAGILGWKMYLKKKEFVNGEGLVLDNADHTISNIGRLAREGMRGTDETIIRLMLQSCM